MTGDLLSALDRSFSYTERLLAGTTDDVRHVPTPCAEYDLTDLILHLITGAHWYAVIPEQGVSDPGAVEEMDLEGQDLVASFRAEADLARRSWTADQLPTVFPTPFGPMSGEHLTGFEVMELVVHGTDVALATGQELRPDEDLVEMALTIATAMGEGLRSPKMMGPAVPVPDGAPVLDRLLGLLGRDPAWTPRP
jgi:uncharacterized protein (TIGR03086 family)